ncbi:hypothetical protein LCGC14_0950800 [marine sediment metagenome]|uniref:HTH cro/C1-type domain-containing protein n=1 Tax=marine sediment metagenome TaxID=412755 RepID=A0A0F9RNT1_9ZZZZ|nr:XRE family transcriptional regulator [Methylophaga sp.]HEC60506.1 XRE family transcriptional regulator [Methylophaga sp.]|tara:strand:+ start:34864 stop:35148 length:285 start_codon:yes stop_codon:yes gene_type:complete
MTINDAFGASLKRIRQLRNMSQEDFSDVSSRTYISTLERGLKSPTIEKVTVIAKAMDVDPLTLLMLTYAQSGDETIGSLLKRLTLEFEALGIDR